MQPVLCLLLFSCTACACTGHSLYSVIVLSLLIMKLLLISSWSVREKTLKRGFSQKSEKRGYVLEEKSEIRVWLSFFGDKHENKHSLKLSRWAALVFFFSWCQRSSITALISRSFCKFRILFKVTPTSFWLKCKNLPKCTIFCSARKLEVAFDKKSSHALHCGNFCVVCLNL